VDSMVRAIINLFERLEVSTCLADYGISKNEVELIVNSAIASGRADNNIVEVDKDDLLILINNMFGNVQNG